MSNIQPSAAEIELFADAAVTGNNEKINHYLDKYGAEIVNQADNHNRSALMIAAFAGHRKTVTLLLDWGADANKQVKDGRTALIDASSRGQIDMIALLLERGALPNIKDNNRRTAATYCAMNGNTEAITMLIKKGSSLDDKDIIGRTAVDWAIMYDHTKTAALIQDTLDARKKQQEQKDQAIASTTIADSRIEMLQKMRPAKSSLKKSSHF